MIKRPNRDETEEDILRMQEEFLAQKQKTLNSAKPAAQAIRVNEKEQSIFAKSKGLKLTTSQKSETDHFKPVIGDIVERRSDQPMNISSTNRTNYSEDGFPKSTRIKKRILKEANGKSLFAQSRDKSIAQSSEHKSEKNPKELSRQNLSTFGEKSCILQTPEANDIHKDNVEILQNMNENEILEERKKLFETLDPSLISFLQSKRKKKVEQSVALETINDGLEMASSSTETKSKDINEILHDPVLKEWHSYNLNVKLESEKFEWMRNVPVQLPKLKSGETYEARFDWKGVLLPYAAEINDENRHLYLHEEDVQRPGYTLQELFRLARSNIAQQRNAAIFSIAGILNIYHQGFYDGILDLPISKIFFLLRFAFDDNTPSQVEISAKALAALLHSDSDEMLLDFIFDCSIDSLEPTLEIGRLNSDGLPEGKEENLEKKLKKSFAFHTNISNEDIDNGASLNDFHLAEVDLIRCVLRSNMIQRINYILSTIKPDNSTVVSCLKILIRLARTDVETALVILKHESLMKNIVRYFLPIRLGSVSTEFYGKPQHKAIKLVRILAAYGSHFCEHLELLNLNEILKNYIFINEDINAEVIRLQMETFRLIKVITLITNNFDLFNNLIPAFLRMLEWHYQFLNIESSSHPIFRQHATALLCLISLSTDCLSTSTMTIFDLMLNKLKLCFSKWFHLAVKCEFNELSQNILLATCLSVCRYFKQYDFSEFAEQYLLPFLMSKNFQRISINLKNSSTLLSSFTKRSDKHEPLPTIDSIVFDKTTPIFILTENYSIYLYDSAVRWLNTITDENRSSSLLQQIEQLICNDDLLQYIENISNDLNIELRTNWFVRSEVRFLINLLKCQRIRANINKCILQKCTHRILSCMVHLDIDQILSIFDLIIFDIEQYESKGDFGQRELDAMKLFYTMFTVMPNIQMIESKKTLCTVNYRRLIFPIDWYYLPLLSLLNSNGNLHEEITERDIVFQTLSFAKLCKMNFSSLISPTEELVFLMASFIGRESVFLETTINQFLKSTIEMFRQENMKTVFQFEQNIADKSIKFENFYISFLEQFQATSYGDQSFSALLMVPLAMKYDVKWRNMVWSEHASVLRFITCTEDQLIGSLDDYTSPIEINVDLIKSYRQSLNSNTLISGSIPYRIAKHHLQNLKLCKTENA